MYRRCSVGRSWHNDFATGYGILTPGSNNMVSSLKISCACSFCRPYCIPRWSSRGRAACCLRGPKRAITTDYMDCSDNYRLKCNWQIFAASYRAVIPHITPCCSACCANCYFAIKHTGSVRIFGPKPTICMTTFNDLLDYGRSAG